MLAHPGWSHEPGDIRRWIGDGLDGVEVRHPRNHPKVRQRLMDMAAEHDLLVTGGSDWHGPDAERAPLGAEDVPMAWMEAVADRTEGRRGAVEAG